VAEIRVEKVCKLILLDMGASAADVITYVGVPLAVIGVLPTLYTFLNALVTLRHIKRRLAENNVAALTRSGLLSGIIEVEIPRKSITPLDRTDETYFKLSRSSSTLKGGSYTLFHWRELSIGTKTYRLAYHEELAQPQAEIDFESLVAFLLDRGAVPSPSGFADLRSSGLWTPTGTKLLLSPMSHDAVLSVAPAEDSDGILSLSLYWQRGWDKRGIHDLPPYWTRIHPPVKVTKPDENKIEEVDSEAKGKDDVSIDVKEMSRASTVVEKKSDTTTDDIDMVIELVKRTSTEEDRVRPSQSSVRLRIGDGGVGEAYYDDDPTEPVRCRHLQAHHNEPNSTSMWFCSAATALRAHEGGLWAFAMPEDVIHLSRRDVIPCGAVVLLGFLADTDVPAWRTEKDQAMENFERQQKMIAQTRALAEEGRLPPEERRKAQEARMRKQMMDFHYECQKRRLEDEKRKEEEVKEALVSQKLTVGRVAEASRQWLEKEKHVGEGLSVALVCEKALWEMIFDEEFAKNITDMLDTWNSWAENGGMSKAQFEDLKSKKVIFAHAACLLGVIKDSGGAGAGDLVADMRECLRMWKKVRLG